MMSKIVWSLVTNLAVFKPLLISRCSKRFRRDSFLPGWRRLILSLERCGYFQCNGQQCKPVVLSPLIIDLKCSVARISKRSWTFFIQLTHTADDAKAKHVSQVQEDKWNNTTKSCVYLHFKMFHQEASVETIKLNLSTVQLIRAPVSSSINMRWCTSLRCATKTSHCVVVYGEENFKSAFYFESFFGNEMDGNVRLRF